MPRKLPVPPTPELKQQIERELTPDLLAKLLQFADCACARLLSIEGRDDPGYARSMVQDAIGDTYAGIRTWDPSARSLRHHLARVITSRVSHDVARARLRRHVSFHEVDSSSDENDAAVEMSLQRDDQRIRPDGRVAQAESRARIYEYLRRAAADDREVQALLDCYESGHLRRDEAMAVLAWSLPRFVNVRRRLDTAARNLPADLRASALELLVRDGGAPPLSVVRRGAQLFALAADGDVVEDGEDPDQSDDCDTHDGLSDSHDAAA